MTLEYIIEQIKNNHCRMTLKREIIIKQLVEHQNVLLTVDDLLDLCHQQNTAINMATIYRNLELLEKLHFLYKKNINRSTSGYKLMCMEHRHHHMICNTCGKLIPIDYCPISSELTDIAKKAGFTITDHKLELYGICDDCNPKD